MAVLLQLVSENARMRARGRTVDPSSVFYDSPEVGGRRRPIDERSMSQRALNQSDGLLRSVAGRGHVQGRVTSHPGVKSPEADEDNVSG
jgi:hypothetical protein